LKIEKLSFFFGQRSKISTLIYGVGSPSWRISSPAQAFAFGRQARQCGKHKLLNYESSAAAEEAAARARAQAEHRQAKKRKELLLPGAAGAAGHAGGGKEGASSCLMRCLAESLAGDPSADNVFNISK
jgi:hypothetical protein